MWICTGEHSILLCSAVRGLMEQINDAFKSLWGKKKKKKKIEEDGSEEQTKTDSSWV